MTKPYNANWMNVKRNANNVKSNQNTSLQPFIDEIDLAFAENLPIAERYASILIISLI